MSGFEHLCVSSSLFEDYDHLHQASRMKNQGPRMHSGAVDISGPVVMLPRLEACYPLSVLFRGTEYTALLSAS